MYVGVPYGIVQLRRKIHAKFVAVMHTDEIFLVCLEGLSVMEIKYHFLS